MSGGSSQRVRKIASPSLKQGPMRATFPFGLRQSQSSPLGVSNPRTCGLRQCNSPTSTIQRPANNGRKCSPSSSPTPPWIGIVPPDSHRKTPRSPDHRTSPDSRNSPSSQTPNINKEKSRSSRHSPVAPIRRTSSLDTYLKGEWPRDAVVPYHTLAVPTADISTPLTAEKASQTPDEFFDETYEKKKPGLHMRSTSLGSGDSFKKETIKARLAKSKEGNRTTISGLQRNSPVPGNHGAVTTATVSTITGPTALHSKAVPIPHIPKPTIHVRGSVEGLSQEIETLVLMSVSGSCSEDMHTQDPTPDGHRAPIADLLRTRNVDTQTPLGLQRIVHEEEIREQEEADRNYSSQSSKSSSPCEDDEGRYQTTSPASLPIIPGQPDSPNPSGLSETLTDKSDCVSPNLKSFSFVREPPDGCEKVKIVHEENVSCLLVPKVTEVTDQSLFCPITKPGKCCIPSEVSAFCPLLKPYVLQSSRRSAPSTTANHASQTIDCIESQ